MRRSWSMLVLVACLLVGCGGNGKSAATSAPSSPFAGSSVLDSLDEAAEADYDDSSRGLLDLLVGPSALAGHRLVLVQVDDPNGNGRIDGRWYPPRIVRSACSVKLDNAPMPLAEAAFVPGDPSVAPTAGQLQASREMLEAPYSVSLSVQVFDERAQRDAFAASTEEIYTELNSFSMTSAGCGGASGAKGGALTVLKRFEPYDAGYPAFGLKGRLVIARAAIIHYRVGDRVLLSVGVQSSLKEESELTSDLDTTFLNPLIDAQIERLRSKELA